MAKGASQHLDDFVEQLGPAMNEANGFVKEAAGFKESRKQSIIATAGKGADREWRELRTSLEKPLGGEGGGMAAAEKKTELLKDKMCAVLEEALNEALAAAFGQGCKLTLWRGKDGDGRRLRRRLSRITVVPSTAERPQGPFDHAMQRQLEKLAEKLQSAVHHLSVEAAKEAAARLQTLQESDADEAVEGFRKEVEAAAGSAADELQLLLDSTVEQALTTALTAVAKGFGGWMGNMGGKSGKHEVRDVLRAVDKAAAAQAEHAAQAGDRPRIERVFGGLRAQLVQRALVNASEFDVRAEGMCGRTAATLWQVVGLRPAELTAQENNLVYLLEKLQQAEEPVQELTWQDSLASWQALMDLLPLMRSQRGVAVLEVIFSSRDVLEAMGAAQQFTDSNGKVPQAVLRVMKEGLGGHIKKNAFLYREMVDREIARIRRIKQLQQRAVGLVGSAFIATMIGGANLASRLIYDSTL